MPWEDIQCGSNQSHRRPRKLQLRSVLVGPSYCFQFLTYALGRYSMWQQSIPSETQKAAIALCSCRSIILLPILDIRLGKISNVAAINRIGDPESCNCALFLLVHLNLNLSEMKNNIFNHNLTTNRMFFT